jgi:protein phosphatase
MTGRTPEETPIAPAVTDDARDATASSKPLLGKSDIDNSDVGKPDVASPEPDTKIDVKEVETDGEALANDALEAPAPEVFSDSRPDGREIKPPPKPIHALVFGRTDVGQIREHNEDNFLIADLTNRVRGIAGSAAKGFELGSGGLLLAVCDGMGGAAAGEVASKLATDIIYERMLGAAGHRERDRLAIDLVRSLEDAGARILAEANSNRACRGMGTTATVATLVDDHLLLGQVGDSRAYVLRGGRLVQVTRDQSLVNQLIEAGQLTEEEAENFEHSNIILQALGTADAVQVDLTFVKLRKGDVLMMCSDGLSGMIRDAEINETLSKVDDPVEACRILIEDANQAGGHDNVTVITAVFSGEGLDDAEDGAAQSLKYQKYSLPAWVGNQAGETAKLPALAVGADDSPSIEINGEFEVDGDMDWDDIIDERPSIPREQGPDMSRVFVWAVLLAALVVFYLWFVRG